MLKQLTQHCFGYPSHTLPDVVAAKAFEPSLPIFAPARFRNTGPGTVGKVQVGVFEAYLAWLETYVGPVIAKEGMQKADTLRLVISQLERAVWLSARGRASELPDPSQSGDPRCELLL